MNEISKDEKTMGMLMHGIGLLCPLWGPLILWLIKKNDSKFIDANGRSVLNFHITFMIVGFIVGIVHLTNFVLFAESEAMIGLFFIIFGIIFLLIMAMNITLFVGSIIGMIRADKGIVFKYPLSFPFLRN